jgi:hypothetical protein
MATRRRSPSQSSSNHNPKSPSADFAPVAETQFQAEADDSQNLWEAECILDERGAKVKGQYLIKWRGIDPVTQVTYEPTWEAKTGCTPDLIDEWKERKRDDPLIVGRAGKEMEVRVKAERKRKKDAQGSNGDGGGKRKKAKTAEKSKSQRGE